uniref:Uncharacterized protein n=1 Tax=Oryza brachyantha TaxID=4533 RepID=J3NB19_ORYBR
MHARNSNCKYESSLLILRSVSLRVFAYIPGFLPPEMAAKRAWKLCSARGPW